MVNEPLGRMLGGCTSCPRRGRLRGTGRVEETENGTKKSAQRRGQRGKGREGLSRDSEGNGGKYEGMKGMQPDGHGALL